MAKGSLSSCTQSLTMQCFLECKPAPCCCLCICNSLLLLGEANVFQCVASVPLLEQERAGLDRNTRASNPSITPQLPNGAHMKGRLSP